MNFPSHSARMRQSTNHKAWTTKLSIRKTIKIVVDFQLNRKLFWAKCVNIIKFRKMNSNYGMFINNWKHTTYPRIIEERIKLRLYNSIVYQQHKRGEMEIKLEIIEQCRYFLTLCLKNINCSTFYLDIGLHTKTCIVHSLYHFFKRRS